MAENKTYNDSPTFIPARLESSVHGLNPVADAKDIYDINHDKWQKDINEEVEAVPAEIERIDGELEDRYTKEETYSKTEVDTKESGLQGQINTIKGGSTKSIATIDNEINGNDGIDERLSTVEELAQISIDGGNIGIATASDFDNPTPEQEAKVPTVGAILGVTDTIPTADSDNLVKSGGVQNELALGAVYDVSAKNPTSGPNNDGKFESLVALLSDANINTLIPTSVRKGGMSIKFVQSSDNKYVQYRLMTTSFSTNERDWQGEDVTIDGSVNTEAELSFVDEDSNCIVQFKNGHIKTKNFDSSEFDGKFAEIDNVDGKTSRLAIVDDNSECIVQFKDGHIRTKNFDSRGISELLAKKNFAWIGIDKLSVSGSSIKSNGVINLATGVANRAYLANGFECNHWDMYAKFKCTGGVSFLMGKDDVSFGAWIEIKLDNGSSTYTYYNNGIARITESLGFDLVAGNEYMLHLFFNVTTTKTLGFEIIGQFDEYFTYTFDQSICNGYGNPFFYSNTVCVVKEFSLSNQRYYDVNNAKCAVWGHSYVEGDSLGSDRDKTFTNLLANALGPTKVFNYGLGGDTFNGVLSKINNEMGFVRNIQYGLVCIGANDRSATAAYMAEKTDEIAMLLINNNIIPIFFTISPISGGNDTPPIFRQNFSDYNVWLRISGYLYVDMEQVFVAVDVVDGNPTDNDIKTDLYLNDYIHPTVQGHQDIFNRIKMDCPYLF